MRNQIERANRAVEFGKWVTVCCAMILAFMALGYLALVGDEIREARMGEAAVESFGVER